MLRFRSRGSDRLYEGADAAQVVDVMRREAALRGVIPDPDNETYRENVKARVLIYNACVVDTTDDNVFLMSLIDAGLMELLPE